MKHKLLLTLGIAVTALVGCRQDVDVIVPEATAPKIMEIKIDGTINQENTTRVNDNGFCDGDGVGIYVVNYQNGVPGTMLDEGNQADNVRYLFNESENRWTPDYPIYYYDKVTPVDIIGYYPYVSNMDNVNAYSFELAKDQSTDAANGLMGGYEASDFLWGKAENISPTAERVNISFNHTMSGVQVELTEGTGWGENEWSGLDKHVLITNTVRKASIDLATGEVTPIGEVPTTGTVPAVNGDGWRAVVVPQTVGASIALLNITVDGTPYIFRKSEAFEYQAGKLHKFVVKVSKKELSGVVFELVGEEIVPWESETITHDGTAREYVVIDVPAASTDDSSALKAAIEASGKDYTKIKNLKVTGEVNSNDFYFMRDEMSVLQAVNMKEVTIVANRFGNSANEIPEEAFNGKTTLVRFVFPDHLTKIGNWAFAGSNLTGNITIPNGVIEIGTNALGSVWQGTGHEGLPIYGTLTLPNTLKIIRAYAFYASKFVGELVIPSSVEVIEDSAFKSTGFTGNLILPDGLKELGPEAFDYCHNLSGSLTIPHNITIIPEGCFRSCNFGGMLKLHNGITNIHHEAFYGCGFRGNLILPDNLITLGNNAFGDNLFSGELKLPESLAVIGDYAFSSNVRLSGTIEIPQDVTTISRGLFEGCSQLEGIVFHKNTDRINESAFSGCYQLNSIVCKSIVPPTIDASAFSGVAKDNFVLEVPESSVADYTLAPNWSEFKRIAAHREFSINRNLFRTLNAEDSKTLLMRAESGAAWSVESCPDWVTVTPSSGVGKTEVTVTVNEMTAGYVGTFDVEVYDGWGSTTTTTYNGRAGEVVFLLDGKDYRTRTKVEQYDYTYGDGDVITNQTATVGKGVNIVFMGDCFDAQDIATGKYLNGMNEAIEHFFAVEPYATYKDYFNVYTVFGLSPDSGMGTVNTIREAKFGSQYMLNEGVQTDGSVCFEYACKTPTVTPENICQTPIVLIENSYEYAAVTQMWDDGSAIAMCPMSIDEYPYDYRGVVQHEAGGHAFGKLGDEYIYHNQFITSCGVCGDASIPVRHAHSLGWYKNLSLTGNIYDVPWSHLIFDEKYQNTVDIYEGGYMHTRGCFRSEPNSCMNNNIPYFSAISRQAIVERIMEYAGEEFSFEEWKAKDKGLATEGAATRTLSVPENRVPYKSFKQQQTPKFMGEKPVLNF
ncbi:MAG: hypothetical protein E7146_00030 [Rikenellaceae bacterium]|nr:hypothetical protein [Rikenellaceae bacterium]